MRALVERQGGSNGAEPKRTAVRPLVRPRRHFVEKETEQMHVCLGGVGMARDDKRRHFLRVEVEACKRLRGVDLFVSHEAARPFLLEVRGRRQDVGKTPINEVLAAIRPRMHLSGHHHVYNDDLRQGVRSIGLDPVGRSYVVIDTASWQYEHLET